MRGPSLMARMIGAIADRLAADPSIPTENRAEFRAQVVIVVESELARLFGGADLLMYVPKFSPERRRAREKRIAAAIAAGEAPERVARREDVSERHVRRIRARFGQLPP